MPQINIDAFGYNEVITKSANYTIQAQDSGTVINVTASCTLTLPATVVGIEPTIRVGTDGITVTIAPNASDNIYGAQLSAVDNKALILTNAPAGSYVTLAADGTTAGGWAITRLNLGGQSSTATKQP